MSSHDHPDALPVQRLAVGLVAFATLHELALAAAARFRADGKTLELDGNRFLNVLTLAHAGRKVTFTRGFGLADDDVIQVHGVAHAHRLTPADRDQAVAMATRAMERALHYLLTSYDQDAI